MHNEPDRSMKHEEMLCMSSLKRDTQAWLSEKCCGEQRQGEGGARESCPQRTRKREPILCELRCCGYCSPHGPTCQPCQLNPIELVWSNMKGFVAVANKMLKLLDGETLLWLGIKQVTTEK
ncbi:hypothetical protein HPB51_024258 [Rhipicephalus microplus]|uniref:Uncharacterized protein n=1 Tax=Rhipicephalus microplus TaxID=6941 RepID=A0A9J6EIZ5_RHIMP|nr:hypothetical protein HPB51_024258 [Rhipicephalus microplus]